MEDNFFNTNKRIKLGIWGLGRGANFVASARALNIDVVAGCDFHPEIRENFQKLVPEAYCTDNDEEFLKQDMDAVLVATYLPNHAEHVIRVLESGKHVMCEVTAFTSPAEGVKLVEAVEKSGKVYNMLENYPFSKENMYLTKLWQEGFFGEFMYGEFEYVHAEPGLSYGYNTFPDYLAVEPGYCAHNWRASMNPHIYCTHSLGPAMRMTGLRPVSVAAPPMEDVVCPGVLARKGRLAPEIVVMSNGGVVRNMMGSSASDYHRGMRIWGTKAAAENLHDDLKIRVGGIGNNSPLCDMNVQWDQLGDLATKAGHGGGDFWELYYFARQILTGEPAPWDIYASADVTLVGLMAIRSSNNGGIPVKIPNFRNPEERDQYRNDQGEDFRDFDAQRLFPDGHDTTITGDFNKTMLALFPRSRTGLVLVNSVFANIRIFDQIKHDNLKQRTRDQVKLLVEKLPEIKANCAKIKTIRDAYPDCIAGQAITSVLTSYDMDAINDIEGTTAKLNAWLAEHP